MATEQFLDTDNISESLSIVRKHMMDEISRLIGSDNLGIKNIDIDTFSLPGDINELPQQIQYKYVSVLHLCESVRIINSKIGA